MNNINKLIAEIKKKNSRIADLNVALFEKRLSGYVLFRLNFFMLRFFMYLAVFIIEYFILSMIFMEALLIKAMLGRVFYFVISSFWWGCLESLREKVRAHFHTGNKHLIKHELARWLPFSLSLSLIYFFISIVILLFMWGESSDSKLLTLYVLAVNLRVTLQFWLLTLHSAVYAIRRIYRPAWSIVCLEITTFALTILLWPFLLEFSFPISAIISTFAVSAIAFHFIKKAYALSDYLKIAFSCKTYMPSISKPAPLKELILTGSTAALIRFDSLIVLGLLFNASNEFISLNSVNFYFILLPFTYACFSWAGLFYFDFKKLQNQILRAYEEFFKRAILLLSVFMGVFFWALYCLTSWMLPYSYNFDAAIYLFPLFIIRSVFAYSQIRSFSEKRYYDLLACSMLIIILSSAGVLLKLPFFTSAVILLFVVSLISFYLICNPFSINRYEKYQCVHSINNFFAKLIQERASLECGYLKIPDKASSDSRKIIARNLLLRIGSNGVLSAVGEREIIWYSRNTDTYSLNEKDIQIITSGMAEEVKLLRLAHDNDQAINFFYQNLGINIDYRGKGFLIQYFRKLFPRGEIISLESQFYQGKYAGSIKYRSYIHGAFSYLKHFLPFEEGRGCQVSALITGKKIDTVFVVPGNASNKLRHKWHKLLKNINFAKATM